MLLRLFLFALLTAAPLICLITSLVLFDLCVDQQSRSDFDASAGCFADSRVLAILFGLTTMIWLLAYVTVPAAVIWIAVWGFFAVREFIRLMVRLFSSARHPSS